MIGAGRRRPLSSSSRCCSRRSCRCRDLRPGSVSRAELIETARGSGCRVVGVTAPAGYGKSTLLAEWAEAEDRPVGWVSLDRFDDDPAALLSVLASAYGRISGHTDLIADVRGLGVSPLGRAAPRLAVGVPGEPGSVRADAGRPARAPVAGLPRRAERGDLGDTARLATGRGESFRAASPAAVAGVGRRAGVRGQ